MRIYVITVEGVYRHEILGVSSDFERAAELARNAARDELIKEQERSAKWNHPLTDTYHSFDVNSFDLDTLPQTNGIKTMRIVKGRSSE